MKQAVEFKNTNVESNGFERPVDSRAAAPLVQIHYKTLEEMARAGEVPAVKLGKKWLFRMSLLNEWLDSQLQMNVVASQREKKN